jgi:hypothetical protein
MITPCASEALAVLRVRSAQAVITRSGDDCTEELRLFGWTGYSYRNHTKTLGLQSNTGRLPDNDLNLCVRFPTYVSGTRINSSPHFCRLPGLFRSKRILKHKSLSGFGGFFGVGFFAFLGAIKSLAFTKTLAKSLL